MNRKVATLHLDEAATEAAAAKAKAKAKIGRLVCPVKVLFFPFSFFAASQEAVWFS